MQKKKWYQGTSGAILFLIVFFPVGLFLMWKHTSWPKMAKGIVSGFFAVLAVIVLIQGPSEEPQPIMPPTQDATVANPPQDTPPTDTLATTPTEEPQLSDEQQAEVDRAVVIFMDQQIYDVLLRSEEITQILQEGVTLVSEGKGTMLDLYDLAKQAADSQQNLYGSLSDIRDDTNKEYIYAVQGYVSNAKSFAQNIVKYIDSDKESDLSKARSNLENTLSYSIDALAARTTYLSENGLSDEEISEILLDNSDDAE